MKISRKLQRLVENKIRHSMATGAFPGMERASATGPLPRAATDKTEGQAGDQAK
jgi:hypothetical protein